MINSISIQGYRPGALAKVLSMHMDYYHKNWGFGLAFETKVANELSEFLSRFNPDKDLFLTAFNADQKCIGSITLDCQNKSGKGAHIRWFIVDQNYCGKGLGRKLMTQAVERCDGLDLVSSYLTTFDGLHAARKLYESFGFRLVEEKAADQWNGGVIEQLFVRSRNVAG